MEDTALFVGWGHTHPGREHHAQENFRTWAALLEELKEKGEIERYEHVMLAPYGGDLAGFTLVFGEQEKLALIQTREDMVKLRLKAALDHGTFMVVWAIAGAGFVKEMELFEELVTELEREPITV